MGERGNELAVVALGGNALIKPGQRGTFEQQAENLTASLAVVVELLRRGHRVLLTHGNGPQVGHILLRVEAARGSAYDIPLDVCVAQSQGEMGYLIQQSLGNLLRRDGLRATVATVLTRAVVARDDPHFATPSKPVGPFYSRGQATAMEQRGVQIIEDARRGYRRVVPSPWPIRIVEAGAVRCLVEAGVIVVAAGGGGIPVIERDGAVLSGVEAVIDKDLATGVLAAELGAERILNLTAVDHAKLWFGTPQERDLEWVTVAEARTYHTQGHFAPGSMGPKIDGAIYFLEHGGLEVVVTTPERAMEAWDGRTGTHVTG